jgi:hypothetical protein
MAQMINIKDIDVEGSTQVRVNLSLTTLREYSDRMVDGEQFPPVRLARDSSGRLRVIDGFHRLQATKGLGRDQILAEVENGTQADALWRALAANKAHGARMSQADRQHAIELALAHSETERMSDHAIALHIGVKGDTVTAHRERLRATTSQSGSGSERGVTTDGRSHPRRNTRRKKKIGRPKGSKNKPKAEPDSEPRPATESISIDDIVDWDAFDAAPITTQVRVADAVRARLAVNRSKGRAA